MLTEYKDIRMWGLVARRDRKALNATYGIGEVTLIERSTNGLVWAYVQTADNQLSTHLADNLIPVPLARSIPRGAPAGFTVADLEKFTPAPIEPEAMYAVTNGGGDTMATNVSYGEAVDEALAAAKLDGLIAGTVHIWKLHKVVNFQPVVEDPR